MVNLHLLQKLYWNVPNIGIYPLSVQTIMSRRINMSFRSEIKVRSTKWDKPYIDTIHLDPIYLARHFNIIQSLIRSLAQGQLELMRKTVKDLISLETVSKRPASYYRRPRRHLWWIYPVRSKFTLGWKRHVLTRTTFCSKSHRVLLWSRAALLHGTLRGRCGAAWFLSCRNPPPVCYIPCSAQTFKPFKMFLIVSFSCKNLTLASATLYLTN